MRKVAIQTLSVLSVLVLFFLFLGTTAYADSPDLTEEGCIEITLRDRTEADKTVVGASLKLYYVAEASLSADRLVFTPTTDFAPSGINLENPNEEGLATDLAAYAAASKLPHLAQAKTTAAAPVRFDHLTSGLYLITQLTAAEGYYPVAPFLVSIPMADPQTGTWLYHVDASPKVEAQPVGPDTPPGNPPVNPPQTPPQTPPDTLIQTGQLNWPIPVLAILGVTLFMLGWYLTFVKGKQHHGT